MRVSKLGSSFGSVCSNHTGVVIFVLIPLLGDTADINVLRDRNTQQTHPLWDGVGGAWGQSGLMRKTRNLVSSEASVQIRPTSLSFGILFVHFAEVSELDGCCWLCCVCLLFFVLFCVWSSFAPCRLSLDVE